MKYMFDRIDGKPKESIGLSSDNNDPMEITINIKDAKAGNRHNPE
jgi:hypothetical protein